MSTFNTSSVAKHLTHHRLPSYLAATDNKIITAVDLYDWNTLTSGPPFQDLSRFELIYRNTLDRTLLTLGTARQWSRPWTEHRKLFVGDQGNRAWNDTKEARQRAPRRQSTTHPLPHGKLIAQLNFGFWRFLATKNYLRSLWVPALANAFPHHPNQGNPAKLDTA